MIENVLFWIKIDKYLVPLNVEFPAVQCQEGVEVSELLSLRTLACVQCDECFIQEINEALQHWTLPL